MGVVVPRTTVIHLFLFFRVIIYRVFLTCCKRNEPWDMLFHVLCCDLLFCFVCFCFAVSVNFRTYLAFSRFCSLTDRETERETDRQRDRQTDRETERQRDRQRDRETDRQAGRQASPRGFTIVEGRSVGLFLASLPFLHW